MKVYQALADAFFAEGVRFDFALMGDGNMYWIDALARKPGVTTIAVRHEHAAVGMAAGYARSTRRVGVASVTNGPGVAQVVTELTVAAQARLPIVLFAADTGLHAAWTVHNFDQRTSVLATGAHFMAVHSTKRMLRDVREAFYIAKFERRPVVLSVPDDLQREDFPQAFDYAPSATLIPRAQAPLPDPEMIAEAVEMLAAAKRPILIAGRGAFPAASAIEELAAQSGALLATSLLAKGLFDGKPFDLGIAGGLSSNLTYDLFRESDLVIGFGAGLGQHTGDSNELYAKAKVIQVDLHPRGMWQGRPVADFHIQGDARLAAVAMLESLRRRESKQTGWRTPGLAQQIAGDTPDDRLYPVPPDTVDPRAALLELDKVIPADWDIVCGPGHYFNFVMSHLRGRAPQRYHSVVEFGAIGSALPQAMGIAAARGDGKVLLIEGDGSIMLHIQEFETMIRSGLPMLVCILNDGAYGAEVHKLRSEKLDPSGATHGRGRLAAIANGFGFRAATVRRLGELERLFAEHRSSSEPSLWDIHIAENIPSLNYRRRHFKES